MPGASLNAWSLYVESSYVRSDYMQQATTGPANETAGVRPREPPPFHWVSSDHAVPHRQLPSLTLMGHRRPPSKPHTQLPSLMLMLQSSLPPAGRAPATP